MNGRKSISSICSEGSDENWDNTNYNNKEDKSRNIHQTERKGHTGIMERSICNIEEYNRSKNQIIIDQNIIDEIFTEKTKNDIASTASYYSVSRNSFDDIGLE